jgi:hypothetical protein
MLAFVVLAEILVLLIAPLTYYALLAPNTLLYAEGREVALTNIQIKEAWPNLPTGDEIKNGNIPYADYKDTLGPVIQNRTRINMFANFGVARIPIAYVIFVQDSNGSWVEVPQQYLVTDNPPEIPSVGFMGTDLPTNYIIIAVTLIMGTFVAGTSYFLYHKKNETLKTTKEVSPKDVPTQADFYYIPTG